MSSIDGRKVNFRDKPEWVGLVMGDSFTPGTVRVDWSEPIRRTGIHHVKDLVVLDAPPTQDDLKMMYAGYRLVDGEWVPPEHPSG